MSTSRTFFVLAVIAVALIAFRPGVRFEGESRTIYVPARWDRSTERVKSVPTRHGKLDPEAVQWTEQLHSVEHLEDDLFASEVAGAIRELLMQGYGIEAVVPITGGVSQLQSLVARVGPGEPGGGAASQGYGRTDGVLIVGVR